LLDKMLLAEFGNFSAAVAVEHAKERVAWNEIKCNYVGVLVVVSPSLHVAEAI
jgi:hypothetical protein